MRTVYEEICERVGMLCIGEDVAKMAVLELLPCIGRKDDYAIKFPKRTSDEITEYLDDIVRNP